MAPHAHHGPPETVTVHVIVVSTTRTAATDVSGAHIAELFTEAGHAVASRSLVDDDVGAIRAALTSLAGAQVVVLTGGTGVAPRDVTPEAVEPLYTRRLDGFGELFRHLSFQDVGSASWLSRASAGLVGSTVVFVLPGSTAACELAVRRLILPELGHLARLLRTPR